MNERLADTLPCAVLYVMNKRTTDTDACRVQSVCSTIRHEHEAHWHYWLLVLFDAVLVLKVLRCGTGGPMAAETFEH